MSSFFKKPSWAKAISEDSGTEFYQRSKQTYSDIVATNRAAHQNPKASQKPNSGLDEPNNQSESSNQDTSVDSERMPDIPEPTRTLNPQLSSPAHHSPPESIDDELAKSPSPKSHSSVSPQTLNYPEAQFPRPSQLSNIPTASKTSSPRLSQSPVPIDDPTVQIVISSEIENTTPLLVRRKMSQGLKEVRLAWCNRQGFSQETHPSIHLTWKGRRLFDVTTCRSLGLHNRSPMTSVIDDHFTEQKELQIHMEAVTDSPILTRGPAMSEDAPDIAANSSEHDQNEPMKLILRSPGYEDFKIKARPKTLTSRLVSAFRDKQRIPEDRSVTLTFDGDNLPPDSCLADHDIDDLDLLDVIIR